MNRKIKIEERVNRLVLAMGEETWPRKGLIAQLGLRQEARRNFYSNYLNPARERGLVTMLFPDIPSWPEQAYLLTEQGKELLAKLKKGTGYT